MSHARSPGAAQWKQRPPGSPGRRIPGIVFGRVAAIVPPRALISMGEVGDVARLPLHTNKLQGIKGAPRAVEILHISDVFEVIVFEIAAVLRDDAFRRGATDGERNNRKRSAGSAEAAVAKGV